MNSSNQIVKWKFPLCGHIFDLEDLPYWFSESIIEIEKIDNDYYLFLEVSTVGSDSSKTRQYADRKLSLINGICSFLSQSYQPISFNKSFYGVDKQGKHISSIERIKPAIERNKAGHMIAVVGDVVQKDPRLHKSHLYTKALTFQPKVEDALIILSRNNITWSELYFLLELVESDVGSQIHKLGWESRNNIKRFSNTVNCYTTLGIQARHGKAKGGPPNKPMSYSEALNVIRNIVNRWIIHITEAANI